MPRKLKRFKGTHWSVLPEDKKQSVVERIHNKTVESTSGSTNLSTEDSLDSASDVSSIPSKKSASWRKLSGNLISENVPSPSTSSSTASNNEEYYKEPEGYKLFSMKMFKKTLEEAHRCCGGELSLNDSEYKKWGMGSLMFLECSKCSLRTYVPNCELSDERYETVKDSGSLRPQDCFDINRRAVLAGIETSIGLEGMKTMCAVMNLPQPGYSQMWSEHTSSIYKAAKEEISLKLKAARKRLRDHLSVKQEREIMDEELLDVSVTYDGTWSHRGWTANYGIGFVMSVDTGEVLDYEVMSKRCTKCDGKQGNCEDPACMKNHIGSSKSMESAAAVLIWNRSMQYHMRYTWMVCDGDSSAYCKVWDVYGACDVCLKYENMKKSDKHYQTWIESKEHEEWFESHEKNEADCDRVHKLDCVGHVQKRMGTALRNWKQKNGVVPWAGLKRETLVSKAAEVKTTKRVKSKGKEDTTKSTATRCKKCKGTHSLTDKVIDKLQNYYGKAIRRNTIHVSDSTNSEKAQKAVQKMQKEIKAILYHSCMLPDPKLRHQYCPESTEPVAWCAYKKGKEVEHRQHFISAEYLPYLEPVFERLSKDSLLIRCVQGLSQNQNECLNGRVWAIASKDKNNGPQIIEIAAIMASIEFNEGRTGLLSLYQRAGLDTSGFTEVAAAKRDQTRVNREEYKVQQQTKERRRKARQGKLQREEEKVSQEGSSYGAGHFND